jgi:hypothetical protein
MDRRQFISALLAASAGMACAAHAGTASRDMVTFVRELYTRQVAARTANTPMSSAEFDALFSRNVRALMHAPVVRPDKVADGPILNALFGWGVLPGLEVKLDKVAPAFDGTGAATLVRVDVDIPDRGGKRQILVRPVYEDGAWRIADITYGSDSGLGVVAYYRRITRR